MLKTTQRHYDENIIKYPKITPLKITPALLTALLGSTLVLSGCQSLKEFVGKRDNGSLDYQQSQNLRRYNCLPMHKQRHLYRYIQRQMLGLIRSI